MAYSGATKILKPGGEQLDQFEQSVSQVSTGSRDSDRRSMVTNYMYNKLPCVGVLTR